MTEIPEHLLKRSRERRAAIGGEEQPADADQPSSSTPAPGGEAATPAAPAPAAAAPVAAPEPEPEPPRPEVLAYQRRRRIPYWALPVLVALPLWAYVYQGTLEPPPAGDSDPLVLGAEIYNTCSACHGSGGGGGTGPALTGVLETFPDYRDHLMWVRLGSSGWPGDTYGAEANTKAGGMPSFPQLSDAELAQVVLYEREAFGGVDPAEEEELLQIAEGLLTFEDVGLGPLAEAAGVDEASLAAGG